jgi:hypothetical protein
VVLINKAIDMLIYRFRAVKRVVDGQPVEVVHHGVITPAGLSHNNLAVPELREMLRIKGVSNLGEVSHAFVEAGGQMSVFTLARPRAGLPLVPVRKDSGDNAIRSAADLTPGEHYACTHCGVTGSPPPLAKTGCCRDCGNCGWTPACIGPADLDLGAR